MKCPLKVRQKTFRGHFTSISYIRKDLAYVDETGGIGTVLGTFVLSNYVYSLKFCLRNSFADIPMIFEKAREKYCAS